MKASVQLLKLEKGKPFLVILLCMALFMIAMNAAYASEVALPRQSNVYIQTNGLNSPERDGDWWTHESHGMQPHQLKIVVPAGVNNFNMAIELFDPESYCTDIYADPDEQKDNGVWEDTRFRLLASNRTTVIHETLFPGGSSASNQQWVPFHALNVTGPNEYYIEISLLATSDATIDDENGYRVRIVNGNADGNEANGNEIGLYAIRAAFQLLGSGDMSYTFGFYVPPQQPELQLYNFDMEAQGPITYTSPNGTEYSGTVSGSSAWNTNPPITTLPNSGGDVIVNPLSGWWQAKFSVRHEDGKNHNANQFVFWPNDIPFDGSRNMGATIGDWVWRDANQNGLQDEGETGVGGILINLLNANDNSVVRTTTSAPDGSFQFNNVPAGTYIVEYISNASWFFSPSRLGPNRNTDSDPDPNTRHSGILTIAENTTRLDVDAGLIPKNISNLVIRKTIEGNSNRFFPDDEFTFLITVTNQGPNPAANVRVMDQLPSGVTFVSATRPADSGPDPLVWYEANIASNASVTYQVTVKAGSMLGTYENCVFVSSPNRDENLNDNSSCTQFFILKRPPVNSNIRIGDRVWEDINQNGIQDQGEPDLANVNVQLLSSPGGNLISSTTTDANGLYEFTNVAPGSYMVAFELLNNYHFTLRDQDGDALDSDADLATGRTVAFAVLTDDVVLTWDAGMVRNDVPPPVRNSIGDLVWEDSDADGIQDADETGLADVNVHLLSSPSASLIASTTTDANGLYAFHNVTPGSYILAFTLLNGYHFTIPGQDGEALDSDADIATGRTIAFSIAAGQFINEWDAGMVKNDTPPPTHIRIGDRVWHDLNMNGLQDEGEPGVREVTVNLLSDGTNILVRSTITDANGLYNFENVPAGSYSVEFVLPADFTFTLLDAGADNLDSDALPATGRTAVFAVVNEQQALDWDAGLAERTKSDIKVEKSVPNALSYYFRNQEVTFLIRVTNNGPAAAQMVRIIDTVPDGLTFVSATPAQSSGPNPLIWIVPTMAVGETLEILVVMQTKDQLGGMDNCVNVSSASVDPDLTNNMSCAQIHILLPVELTSFVARTMNNQVVLEWITQSETENLGFHLLRSDKEMGPYTQVSQVMIKGAGTTSSAHHYQYQDLSAGESKTYYYKLVDVDYNGRLNLHGPINVTMELPSTNVLEQNYPNPFNPSTRIRFILKEQGPVSLTIFNIKGEKVRELVAKNLNAGAHIVEWDGMEQSGRQVPSGMYMYALRMNGFEQKRMMMFLK